MTRVTGGAMILKMGRILAPLPFAGARPSGTVCLIANHWGRAMDDIAEVELTQDGYALDEDKGAIRLELERLRQEHQDLDAAVMALQAQADANQLQIVRIKKRKLVLRDQIAKLENRLTPDLIA